MAAPLIDRVLIRNYKSIGSVDVSLGPLTFLVGPNGSGKSNFLDALRFLADALNTTVEQALRERGGINEVRRRSGGHPTHFSVRVAFRLRGEQAGSYTFRIGSRSGGGFEVQSEECTVAAADPMEEPDWFKVIGGRVTSSIAAEPRAARDRLYLVAVSGTSTFEPVFDALSRMGFYNLNPVEIRTIQQPDAGTLLARDGWNIASVVGEMGQHDPDAKLRVEEYLQRVVPGVRGVTKRALGAFESLEFQQSVVGAQHPWRFSAASMSDGTLRALGVLVALFQSPPPDEAPVSLVGIEEPEVALHPAAAGVLLDALMEASGRVQVVVTSHSPDLLDNDDIPTDALLAVTAETGSTAIGPLRESSRSALRDHLFSAGELLRLDELKPDRQALLRTSSRQLPLFTTDH